MSHKTATVAHTIGIDTGKNTLHLIGLDDQGAIVVREKIARGRIAARLANVPRCLIGIEAGMATHYVARESRLCRLAGARSQADLDRGPYHPRQVIQAWQSLSAGSVRAGGVGRADQADGLGAPRAEALDRGGQETAASQRAGDRPRQQARPGLRGAEDESGSEPIRLIPIPRQGNRDRKNEEPAMM